MPIKPLLYKSYVDDANDGVKQDYRMVVGFNYRTRFKCYYCRNTKLMDDSSWEINDRLAGDKSLIQMIVK